MEANSRLTNNTENRIQTNQMRIYNKLDTFLASAASGHLNEERRRTTEKREQ